MGQKNMLKSNDLIDCNSRYERIPSIKRLIKNSIRLVAFQPKAKPNKSNPSSTTLCVTFIFIFQSNISHGTNNFFFKTATNSFWLEGFLAMKDTNTMKKAKMKRRLLLWL